VHTSIQLPDPAFYFTIGFLIAGACFATQQVDVIDSDYHNKIMLQNGTRSIDRTQEIHRILPSVFLTGDKNKHAIVATAA
jgi:hypothetical protein